MKKQLRHAWIAVRYGDWHCGWDAYKPDPFFSCISFYYDGHHTYARIGRLWFGVSY